MIMQCIFQWLVKRDECLPTEYADVCFVVDSSESVGKKNWANVRSFLNDLIDNMVIGDDNVSTFV